MIRTCSSKLSLLNTVKKHSKLITSDLNHESNFVHSVEEYVLALNISPIDSETLNNNFQDDTLVLKNLCVSYPNNIIIGHLNINSIRNKFEMLSLSVAQYVDILMLSETKLDSTFPSTQFLVNGFSIPHRLDRDSKSSGILLYVRDKITVLPLKRYSLPPHIEILFFELNLRNRKWLLCCSYNPPKNLIKEHLRVLTEGIQFCSEDYKKSF